MMEIRTLGRTGIQIPVVGMGTWKTFDVKGQTEEAYRTEILKAAYDAGALLYDSSPMYGESERVLGQSIDQLNIRDKSIIATKVWTDNDAIAKKQYEDSFRYFGGRVELYQVHNLVKTETRLNELEKFRKEGKVKAIGITHYLHEYFGEVTQWMKTGRVDFIQIPYNAADRLAEQELLPLAEELNLGVLIMRPLGVGKLAKMDVPPAELEPFREYGVTTWPQVLLKWILSDQRVTAVIPATSKAERMTQNAAAGSGPLFDEETRERVCGLVNRYA